MLGSSLTLPILIGAAVIDSINPCAFGVIIFLLAYLTKKFGRGKKILTHGLVYILAVFITYLAAGLVLLPIIRNLGNFSTWSYIVIAVIIIIAGLLEIKDYFWYSRGPSLAIFPAAAQRIEIYVKHVSDYLVTSFLLGAFVALVELPCTGAVYLAVLALISLAGLTINNFLLLIIYNLLFILPLVIILLIVYKGGETGRLEKWRKKYREEMRLLTGLLLVALGIWMVWFTF